AAGVAEGGRTGLTAVVVGVLFLVSIVFAPIAGIVPAQATAPALILVGYFMFQQARDFAWDSMEDLFPALVTAIIMPLTFRITDGIAAGFLTFVFLRVVKGRTREIHPLLWVVVIGFALFYAVPWIQTLITPAA